MHIYAIEMHKYASKKTTSPAPVLIAGARGYSGLELVRILLKHPGARIEACFASDARFRVGLPSRGRGLAHPVLPMSEFKETPRR